MSRAMVVVAAGSGTRFAGDKLMAELDGRRLVELTVSRLLPLVDELVLVCRADHGTDLEWLGVPLASGGATRTASERSGLAALQGEHELVGIHDGARPNVFPGLVERLFATALAHGGAVPVLPIAGPVVTGEGQPLRGVMAAQTPQVFHGPELLAAYRNGEHDNAYDTAEMVRRHGDLQIAAVEGDPRNLKVTYPCDLAWVIR